MLRECGTAAPVVPKERLQSSLRLLPVFVNYLVSLSIPNLENEDIVTMIISSNSSAPILALTVTLAVKSL